MRALRLIAALFVTLSVSLYPLIIASSAYSTNYTYAEYSAQLEAANSAVSDAQAAVDAAQLAYDNSALPVVTSVGSGIAVDIYNNTFRTMSPNPANICRSDVFPQIAANWGGGSVAGCNSDRVTIHYHGTITVPDSGIYYFRNIADDGFYLTINGQTVINEWRDKGCGGNWGTPIQLTAGAAYTLDGWFYENGGGACSTLYVMQPSGNWQVVPFSWFGASSTITYIKDPDLLDVLNQKKAELQAAQDALAAIPPLEINAPENLTASVDGATVTLSWDAPSSALIPERYAVMWTCNGVNGWGVASTQTSIVLDPELFSSTCGWDNDFTFTIRSDHDTAQLYSAYSNAVTVHLADPNPPVVVVIPPAPVETQPATVDTQTSETSTPSTSDTQTVIPDPVVPVDTTTSTDTTSIETSPAPVEPPPSPTPAPLPSPEPVVPPAPTPQPSPEPSPPPTPEPSPEPTPAPKPTPEPEPTPAPSPEPAPSPSPTPAPEPSPAPTPAPEPAPAPSPTPEPSPEPPVVVPGLVENNPNSLPDDIPKQAPAEVLVPHVQEDKAGVENGGIEFFGTKSQPQVVGEDGKLTPPPPPPGSGLPIPPDAITTVATFIGQPGGTTFNAPDIAVPIIETPVTGALAAVPGVQALNHAFVAVANIGNDMSPITRKKAKKILVATLVAGQIAQLRRRF